MKNEDLEIKFALELIKIGDENLLEMYKELLQDRLDEAEERNKWLDKLGDRIEKFNITGDND